MVNPRTSTAVACNTCNKTISRKADLARHMRVHLTNKEALMHACPHPECTYKTLQRSNLTTHLNVHSRERPNKCFEDGCDFSTSDPGSLTRHRKEVHGYETRANSRSHPSTITRKAARQQRRISPYTPSSSISPSCSDRPLSTLDPSPSIYSPRPRVPAILDLSPPSSHFPANAHEKGSIKNTSVAYSTELIKKLPRVNDSGPAPNRKPENSLLTSGLSTALEAPTVGYTQLPVPEQGNLCAADLPALPVSAETTPVEVSDAMLDEFLAQSNNWYPMATPAYTAPPLPAPFGQYPADNVHTPAPLSSYLVQYTADNVTVPTPASHPSYWAQYTNNPSYSYPTGAVTFDAQFSQRHPFTAPDMGFYPRGVDQTYFYTAPVATSNFQMQGINLY